MNDTLFITAPKDTLYYQTQLINNQYNNYTKTDKVIGNSLVGLWLLGLIYTILIFKKTI